MPISHQETPSVPRRGMLLCAGLGTRLGSLTEHLPKPLVPVLARPLALYNLMLLRAAGVREVMINLHHLGDLIPEVLGDGRELGLTLHYSREETLLGTGGGMYAVREFLAEGPCVVANGDTICEADLAGAIARHADRGALATMLLHPHPAPEAYGAVRTAEDGSIAAIDRVARRPAVREAGAYVFAGISVLEPAFLELLEPGPSCVIRTAWRRLIESGAPIYGDPVVQRLHDCGTPARLLEASRDLLRHPGAVAHLPRPATHEPAGTGTLVSPVLVGRDVELGEGAVVGPDVVLGDRVRVAPGVRVRNAVAWPGAVLGSDVEGTIVA